MNPNMLKMSPIHEDDLNVLKLNLAKFCAGVVFIRRTEYPLLASLMDVRLQLPATSNITDAEIDGEQQISIPAALIESCLRSKWPAAACAKLFRPYLECSLESFTRITEPVNDAIRFVKRMSDVSNLKNKPEDFFYFGFKTSVDDHAFLNQILRIVCLVAVLNDDEDPLSLKEKKHLLSYLDDKANFEPLDIDVVNVVIELVCGGFVSEKNSVWHLPSFLDGKGEYSSLFYSALCLASPLLKTLNLRLIEHDDGSFLLCQH
jgi:hypothetical protein